MVPFAFVTIFYINISSTCTSMNHDQKD